MKLLILKLLIIAIIPFSAIRTIVRKMFKKSSQIKMGLLNIEFFHKDIGVFGGYGMTTKNIADHFNGNNNRFNTDILLTRTMPFRSPEIRKLDNTNVIFHIDPINPGIINILKYAGIINRRGFDLLITIEYYSVYLYSILLLPKVPLIIWIHDPRPEEELKKISTVSLVKLLGESDRPKEIMEYERRSLKRIIKLSKIFRRKIIFGTTANCLIDLAKKTYELPYIQPIFLPTPVEIPEIKTITYSSKPTVCFLGRLDPIKRPWIFFELAKRLKDVEFVVAGKTHSPTLMNPIIEKYSRVPNLKFLGLVTGKDKDELLKNTWAIVNTSIHEALPVSFLESLAYGKPIISCQNPDNLVSKFGVYTGEILGDGTDDNTITIFSEALKKILSKRNEWEEKGNCARELVKQQYSFQKFESIIKEIM